jgi:hopene-associated glycosyltransferase HpnB
MITFAIAALSWGIWLYLIGARGMFWRMAPTVFPNLESASVPRVAIIVPARNEADVIAHSVRSLLAQDYPGPLHIVVVDDQSSDETAAVVHDVAAERGERVTMIASAPLPVGWTGKMWALSQGVQQASVFAPDYFLFTDADIVHDPQSVSSMVTLARAGKHDLVSMMVTLRCESFAERALIPALVFFFFMLYPPAWVNSNKHQTAAAAGGDILVRRAALERIGGVGAIRHELIDDCALAREIKRNGSVWLGLTKNARSIRAYESFGVIGHMISRNAFYQLKHSVWLLIGTLIAMAVTYAAPPVLLFFGGWTMLLGASAWLLMTCCFIPIVRFYSLSPLWALALPLVAIFYAGATVHSAIQYWLGRGGEWKDRVQDAPPGAYTDS